MCQCLRCDFCRSTQRERCKLHSLLGSVGKLSARQILTFQPLPSITSVESAKIWKTRDQPKPGSLYGKMRDSGNEVGCVQTHFSLNRNGHRSCSKIWDVYKTWTGVHGPPSGPGPWTTPWTSPNFQKEIASVNMKIHQRSEYEKHRLLFIAYVLEGLSRNSGLLWDRAPIN